jgi:hypothetical protein
MSVCVVIVDEGNNEGVCDDVLDMEKIITELSIVMIAGNETPSLKTSASLPTVSLNVFLTT